MTLLNEALGDYVSHRVNDAGVEIIAGNASLAISLYSASVCRVRILRTGQPAEPFSYAVVQEPREVKWELVESEAELDICTDMFILHIGKFPLRLSFQSPEEAEINADDPAFGTSWIGDEVTTYKRLQPGERFLGLGEKTGNLDRRGSACTNWNTDRFDWPVDADPLYTTFPFYIGVHSGLSYGIYLDSTWRTTFNFGASNDRFSFFSAEAGEMDYYFIHDQSVAEILFHFTRLVGRAPLPPLWSLGYQQCRFSYYPEHEIQAVARAFRDRDIPADVLYFDIHYMDGFRVFTWDTERFPEPGRLVAELNAIGFHAAAILDPGVKIEDGYAPYEDGLSSGVFLTYPDRSPYAGQVWPGWCHFPDFTAPHVRKWWAEKLKHLVETGIEGFWNDMNEPSAWGQSIPSLVEFDYDGHKACHRKARNVYGMLMARSSYEGARRWLGNSRPFVLTRAAFMGVQRFAAVWTGDNSSDDGHLFADVQLVNSMGMTGVAFCGYDIGGFAGESSPDLFARWISIGALAPLCRGHTMVDSRDAEPWSFGETVEGISRNFIKFRYRLLPYIYSLFDESSRTGMPVARSLAIEYTHDPRIYAPAYQHQYLFGPYLLVAPAASTDAFIRLYLPEGRWYDLYTDEILEGERELIREAPLAKPPLFVRAGAVVPMQAPVCCTAQVPEGPLELHIYAGGDDRGGFTYYEDDGVSFDYQEGAFLRRRIRLSDGHLILEKADGGFSSGFERIKFFFHGFGFDEHSRLRVNGEEYVLQSERLRFFAPLTPLGIREMDDPYGELQVHTAEVDHLSKAMHVNLPSSS